MLGIGDTAVIRRFNAFVVPNFLILGSVLFVYTIVLWFLGFITFLGDALAPGYVWKVPGLVTYFLILLFSATRNGALKIPILIAILLAAASAVVEVILLIITLLGCLADSLPIPCGNFDLVLVGVLLGGAAIYAIAVLIVFGGFLSYQVALRRKLIYSADQAASAELELQSLNE